MASFTYYMRSGIIWRIMIERKRYVVIKIIGCEPCYDQLIEMFTLNAANAGPRPLSYSDPFIRTFSRDQGDTFYI